MDGRQRQKVLIIDDSEMNRSILADILENEYEIMEAENGVQGVELLQTNGHEISLVLLDIVMPEMDGFGVLEFMNTHHWIDSIPVIMISAETQSSSVERAYEQGVTDFINRPFDARIVRRRSINTILLYAKQKKLEALVAEQIYAKEQQSILMVDVLSHIVEFRNGESGLHVIHVRRLTELLLKRLVQKTDRYKLTRADIASISTASALHDIGKISIDEKVLNKPGRLTDEEFAIMKTHALVGAQMLENLPVHQNEPQVKIIYSICRWHHERYDGRGYPDGLKGDEIPIAAQVVSIADVYDALTSERVYKKAFSHEKAIQMILNGECGVFNPLLLECLKDLADSLEDEMRSGTNRADYLELENITNEIAQHTELSASKRTLQLLEQERMKYNFFAAMSQEIQFEYSYSPAIVSLNAWGANKLGLPEIITDPMRNEKAMSYLSQEDWDILRNILHNTTPDNHTITHECKLHYNGEARWYRIVARTIWTDDPPRLTGVIGKATDIHRFQTNLESLERRASYDMLTELLNLASAKQRIETLLHNRLEKNFALAIFDLDHFKLANDRYGHLFGNQVLAHVAGNLRQNVRNRDIAARIGGDEFLIFLEYKQDLEPVIQRIFSAISGEMFHGFRISASMGVALTEQLGRDYNTLFKGADQALYAVKEAGRGKYRFYDGSIGNTLPDSSEDPVDSIQEGEDHT